MTIPSFTDAPSLRTDADVLARVNALVGPACAGRQLWVMLVDGDDRQLPTVLPIAGIPRSPDRRGLHALERLVDGLRDQLATDRGPGSVVFTLERTGVDAIMPADREWSDALRVACAHRQVALRGVFLSSDSGVRRMDRP
jgi:hypothetical protein